MKPTSYVRLLLTSCFFGLHKIDPSHQLMQISTWRSGPSNIHKIFESLGLHVLICFPWIWALATSMRFSNQGTFFMVLSCLSYFVAIWIIYGKRAMENVDLLFNGALLFPLNKSCYVWGFAWLLCCSAWFKNNRSWIRFLRCKI